MNVVADSSFYLCFLEDIQRPQYLESMLSAFKFLVPPMVREEVSKCNNFKYVQRNPGFKTGVVYSEAEEALRPLFSAKQWQKGEAQAIAMAFDLFS